MDHFCDPEGIFCKNADQLKNEDNLKNEDALLNEDGIAGNLCPTPPVPRVQS